MAIAARPLEAGADAIFPEALNDAETFARFSAEVKVPLLANMTEFGKTPFMTAPQFQALGYQMVIWPVSALRMAAKALIHRMQTRSELYSAIGYHDYEDLDSSIVRSLVPNGNPD